MRTIFTLVFGLVASSLVAAEPALPSLSELLSERPAVGFQKNLQSSMYQFQLLSPELITRSKEYYGKRKENIDKVRELEKSRLGRSRREVLTPEQAKEDAQLQEEIKKYSRPTDFQVGDVTRRGPDYIGVREFGSSREYIIPFSRIEAIIVDHPTDESD